MKRQILVICSLVIAFSVKAQELHLGIKGGINLAYLNGYEEIAGDDLRLAHHFGVYADIVFSEKLSLQTDVLFSAQGANYEDSEDFEDGNTILYTDDEAVVEYINVPVVLKFYPAAGFNLQIGPQIGFLLNAKNTYKENGISREQDYEEYIKSADFGVVVGLGYKMKFGLNIDARYIHGLSNMLTDEALDDFQIDDDLNNQLIQISLGYSIFH